MVKDCHTCKNFCEQYKNGFTFHKGRKLDLSKDLRLINEGKGH